MLSALHAGRRCWPVEIVLRGIGLLFLAGCWRLTLTAHRMATAPAPHPARFADLAVCAGIVMLFCSGLALAFVGAGLFRDVPLPPHFTRGTDFRR